MQVKCERAARLPPRPQGRTRRAGPLPAGYWAPRAPAGPSTPGACAARARRRWGVGGGAEPRGAGRARATPTASLYRTRLAPRPGRSLPRASRAWRLGSGQRAPSRLYPGGRPRRLPKRGPSRRPVSRVARPAVPASPCLPACGGHASR